MIFERWVELGGIKEGEHDGPRPIREDHGGLREGDPAPADDLDDSACEVSEYQATLSADRCAAGCDGTGDASPSGQSEELVPLQNPRRRRNSRFRKGGGHCWRRGGRAREEETANLSCSACGSRAAQSLRKNQVSVESGERLPVTPTSGKWKELVSGTDVWRVKQMPLQRPRRVLHARLGGEAIRERV